MYTHTDSAILNTDHVVKVLFQFHISFSFLARRDFTFPPISEDGFWATAPVFSSSPIYFKFVFLNEGARIQTTE